MSLLPNKKRSRNDANDLFGDTSSSSLTASIFGDNVNSTEPSSLFDSSNQDQQLQATRAMIQRNTQAYDTSPKQETNVNTKLTTNMESLITVAFEDYYKGSTDNVEEDELRLLLGKCHSVMMSEGVLLLTSHNHSILDSALLQEMSEKAKKIEMQVDKALEKRHGTETASTKKEQSFRYAEVASRCTGRYDIRYKMNEPPFSLLQENVYLQSLMSKFLGETFKLVYIGLIVSKPNSTNQPWHQDGEPLFGNELADIELPPHAMNVFIPLIDITQELGPTEFVLHSQHATKQDPIVENDIVLDTESIVAPLLKLGDVLVYDYRACHRGTANLSASTTRPMVYMIYAKPWFQEHLNFGDKKLFQHENDET